MPELITCAARYKKADTRASVAAPRSVFRNVFPKERSLSESLTRELERARRISNLPEDWDGEGARPIDGDVLERALSFVRNHARWFFAEYGEQLDTPSIEPGPDGSIDVHWENESYELLVSIPADPTSPSTYYGDNYSDAVVKGSFDSTKINRGFLLLWKS
ncbi:MAG: hypothetical protein R6V85_14410 [Polyangia bacterium]